MFDGAHGWDTIDTHTFHVYTGRASAIVTHELLDLIVAEDLCGGSLARHEHQEVSELLEVNSMRVRG